MLPNRPRLRAIVALTLLLLFGGSLLRWTKRSLFVDPVSAILLGNDGTLLGAKLSSDEQWRFPPLTEVPDKYKKALLAHEDKRFPYHMGVDPLALGRAFYLNAQKKRVVSGGSTITMQVVRLSRKNPPRTYREKFWELFRAFHLELSYSKKEILALYANNAPFGGNVVGIEAASWRYFNRPPEMLSWAENCLLAVLPKSPSLIHMGRNRDILKARRDRLIKKLEANKTIDEVVARLSLMEPLPLEAQPLPRLAPHLLDTVMVGRLTDEKRITTTLSAPLQLAVQTIVSRHAESLKNHGILNVAAIVVENTDFSVLAYAGNSHVDEWRDSGFAMDLIRRPRSTGSILKPILYAVMLEAGDILPSTLVPDIPTQFGSFKPENFDQRYRGAVPARMALARSLNVPAVRMLHRYGVGRFYDVLKTFGLTTLHRAPEDYGLSLILGGAEGTLWDVTQVYANFSRVAQGSARFNEPVTLHHLRLFPGEPRPYQRTTDISPGSAYLTMTALLEVSRPDEEGFWKRFSSARKIAWKTGTSYGHRDAWAIGSDAHYTVGVWVGNASGEGKPTLVGLGAAAPVLFDIFNRLEKRAWFDEPGLSLKEVAACKENGYLPFGDCETEIQLAPLHSHFDQVSPHHHILHLDPSAKWRVHGQCESVNKMVHRPWFVLPPAQEFYFRKFRADYRPLPLFRPDCAQTHSSESRNPLEFIYPEQGAKIYIPIDLAGVKGRTVFEITHRDSRASVFWHLNGDYIGRTTHFHQQALDILPGPHELTVVDQEGHTLTRRFEVLTKDK